MRRIPAAWSCFAAPILRPPRALHLPMRRSATFAAAQPTWASAIQLNSVTDAYAANGFIEIDAANLPGLYRVDWPAEALAPGVDRVLLAVAPAAAAFAAAIGEVELVDATLLPMTSQVSAGVPFGDPASPQIGAASTTVSCTARIQI